MQLLRHVDIYDTYGYFVIIPCQQMSSRNYKNEGIIDSRYMYEQ